MPDSYTLRRNEDSTQRTEAGAEQRPAFPVLEQLLVPTPEAARACGISEASWFRLKAAGKTPAPVRLGGKVLYRIEDLKLWVLLGCPPRREFEARAEASRKGGRV